MRAQAPAQRQQQPDGDELRLSTAGYRGLLAVHGFPRLYAGTTIGRSANQMWQVAIVLLVLQNFHSPALAGITVFLGLAPGLLLSPLAGALLDRHGRVRLIALDYLIAGGSQLLLASLALTHRLTPPVMLPLVVVGALTGMLSSGGTRSMFPLLLPRPLWDRGNALDSTGYTITSIIGPALAGTVAGVFGADAALLATAGAYFLASVTMSGVPDPRPSALQQARLLHSAAGAVAYVVRNPTLRALAVSLSVTNLGMGVMIVGLPLLVLQRFHGTGTQVGELWAVQGVAGAIGGLVYGRGNSDGRERATLALGMLCFGVGLALLGIAASPGIAVLGVVAAGFAWGPTDVALFSIRQRRTPPMWYGRAFAVSMSLNFAGAPIGSAVAGPLLAHTLGGTLLAGSLCAAAGAMLAWVMIPRLDGGVALDDSG